MVSIIAARLLRELYKRRQMTLAEIIDLGCDSVLSFLSMNGYINTSAFNDIAVITPLGDAYVENFNSNKKAQIVGWITFALTAIAAIAAVVGLFI
jgi:hypothetical protein